MVLFYDYKFSELGIIKIFKIIYSYGSFLWLQIFKNGYTREGRFFCMVLFYDFKFSKIDISKILK